MFFDKDNTEYFDEIIKINVSNKNSNNIVLLTRKFNECSFVFAETTLNNLIPNKTAFKMPLSIFKEYLQRILKLSNDWSLPYEKRTNEDLEWLLDINTKNNKTKFFAKGEVPNNWNEFIDLLAELEMVYKKITESGTSIFKIEKQTNNIEDIIIDITNHYIIKNTTNNKKCEPERNNKIAEKNSWKTVEMPIQRDSFILNKQLTEKDIEQIKQGHIPCGMEDKWFWYVEDNRLYLHRSWSGYCIYIVDLNTRGQLNVIVNRNKEQYPNEDMEEEKDRISKLLDYCKSNK